ncbi:hypothetical protein Tco_0116807 [Tanacetum coccineum]
MPLPLLLNKVKLLSIILLVERNYGPKSRSPVSINAKSYGHNWKKLFKERAIRCAAEQDTETLPHEKNKLEPETITEVVEIASSQSTPLVSPSETPPLFAPKPKKNLDPNPHQPLIPYPSRLQEENFQALENPTGHADHFIYRIDIVDSLCDKFPIENNSLSGNSTPSSDFVVESLSPSLIPCGDSDSLVEEISTLLSHFNDSSPDCETFCFDIEEKSSGSTTSHSDHSLPDYESFCFDVDHIIEKSSGSTTSHSDLSLLEYESFHFDLSIDSLPPADKSDSHHEEFTDELAHIISQPEIPLDREDPCLFLDPPITQSSITLHVYI